LRGQIPSYWDPNYPEMAVVAEQYDSAIDQAVTVVQALGKIIDSAQSSSVLWVTTREMGGADFEFHVDIINGTEFITLIRLWRVALNATHLPYLLQDMPQLQTFWCENCYIMRTPLQDQDNMLPPNLPELTPQLKQLVITSGSLVGPLPSEFGKWKSLELLQLYGNDLTSTLPIQWKGMRSLQTLELNHNR
jgi:hypothetical protein